MRLREISQYLSQVVAGKLPMNQAGQLFLFCTSGDSLRTNSSMTQFPSAAGDHIPVTGDLQPDARPGKLPRACGCKSRKLPRGAVVQYPVRAGAEPRRGVGGGGGGLVKKSLRLGVPHPISAPGRLPKTVFWSIFRVSSAWSRFCAFLRRNGTGLMLLMLAGRRAWRHCRGSPKAYICLF